MITVSHEPRLFTMADVNVNAPEVPSAADAPPTRSDEQILPPFTASSTIPSIYIQQFWNTIRFDKDKGYNYQLDEHHFYLTKATLRDALQLPTDNDNFTPPPNVNTIISFVNDLGYPNAVINIYGIVTNDMYQPWRAFATIINLFLTGKTSGFERPRAPVLQILWGIVNMANIDYAERIWEEFTPCIHSFIEDKINLTIHAEGKKKVNPLVILGVRFTKLIINHLQIRYMFHKRPGSPLHMPYDEYALGYLKFSFKNTKRVRFGMTIPNTLIIEDIRTASYYLKYVAKVAKYQQFLTGEEEKKRKRVLDATEAPSQAKCSKAGRVSKKRTLPLRDEFIDEGVPALEPRVDDEEAIVQKVLEESMKDAYPAHQGPLPFVVFREPDSGKLQPLPEVQGKGKEKVGEEQATRTPVIAEPSGLVESSSLYAELGLTDSGTESDEEVSPEMNAQGQEEGQGGTNPGDAGVSQTPSSHVVYAGPNLDHMDSGIAEASSQPNTEQMDDEFTATTYPKVQENLKLPTEGEVRLEEPTSSTGTLSSMKNLDKDLNFIDQFLDTSSIPLMTTPVIDITDPQSDSTTVPASMPTSTAKVTETTTTTTVPPPPPQPREGFEPL
ncbi:hypothetical protein Tco_0755881 [Tanacetum coccineum]